MSDSVTPVLKPGENCWRLSRAARGGFLLSSRDYFRAFRQAVLQAEHEVVILAWDIGEAIEMIRTDEDDDGYPSALADFLFAVLEEKPALTIRILLWDYSVFYLAERDWLPFSRWRNPGHERLVFATDDAIAVGASHHQKMVVVDGALAFCGGIDLASWRWDRPEHRAVDDARRTSKDEPYQPYHDVQMVLTGEVAAELRELASIRWERATGDPLPELETAPDPAPWPETARVDFEDEELGIALTFSRYRDYEPSEHIERLHLEVIRQARHFIYIENQYLSSHALVEALCERLREPDGPEVVMVLTREAGWAEEGTLGVLRDRLLELLDEADEHDRFLSCFPFADDGDGGESQVYVHAKLLIADDRMLLTGSANLSNRSMKVDSELDLCFLHDEPADFIRALRENLLAMHFQLPADEVREACERQGSLAGAIEGLRESGGNRLRELEGGCSSDIQRRLADSKLLDPDEPISPIHQVWDALRGESAVLREKGQGPAGVPMLKAAAWIAGFVVAGIAISRLWASYVDQESVTAFFEPIKESPYALPLLVLVFVAAGVLAVPINLVVIGAVLTWGPWPAFGCGFAGSLLGAAVSFGIGHHFGKPLARRVVGEKLDTLSNALADRGVWSVAVIRMLPIAPYGLVNLAAGVSGLRFRVFMIGTAIGLLPGLAAVTFATRRFLAAIENPDWTNWAVFLAIAAALVAVTVWVRRHFT